MNKEQVYDEQINPLMAQIIEICRGSGIAMIASFAIPTEADPGLSCTSMLPDETGKNVPSHRRAMAEINGRSTSIAFTVTTPRQG